MLIAEALGYSVHDNNAGIAVRLSDWERYTGSFFVATGDASVRLEWFDRLRAAGKRIATLISGRAYVCPSAAVGVGSIVELMAVINTGAKIGKGVLVCAGAVVNHNYLVGGGYHLDVRCVIAKTVRFLRELKLKLVLCGDMFRGNRKAMTLML